MRTAKHWILLNTTLALLAVATEGEAQNAPPTSAGWHSLTAQGGRAAPIAIDQRTCFARAQQALQTLVFYDLAPQGGWALTGVRGSLKASIHCVAMGNGSMIDVAVAAPAGFAGQTAQVRDALRDAMLGRGGGADALGRRWKVVSAGGWTAVWTRRSNSNTFDGLWTGPQGQRATTVITVTMDGRNVTANRTQSSDGFLCRFTGQVATDGVTVSGSARCGDTTFDWNARIIGDAMLGRGGGADALGRRWKVVSAGGWTAVWTRRSNSNTFDGLWTGPQGQRATTVITVTMDGRNVTANRTQSSDGFLCRFTGQVATDGVTVSGSARCGDTTFDWNARIIGDAMLGRGGGADTLGRNLMMPLADEARRSG